MAQRAAVGHGPVAYFTDAGVRVMLPLREIYFEGDDVKTRTSTPASAITWLKYLVARGRLVPGEAPAPGSAVALTAAAAGWNGNRVVVTVTANSADAAKVDISVTETNTYEDLTLASLPTILGTGSAAGTRPGLVRFKPSGAAGTPPDPAETTGKLETPAGTLPAWTIAGPTPASTTTSFTLEARGPGSETGTMTIEVTDVTGAAGAKAFTLNVAWKSNTITAVTENDLKVPISDPASKLRGLAFAVLFSEPPGGSGVKLPRPGVVTLRGGANAAAAIQATATLLAPNG